MPVVGSQDQGPLVGLFFRPNIIRWNIVRLNFIRWNIVRWNVIRWNVDSVLLGEPLLGEMSLGETSLGEPALYRRVCTWNWRFQRCFRFWLRISPISPKTAWAYQFWRKKIKSNLIWKYCGNCSIKRSEHIFLLLPWWVLVTNYIFLITRPY
jgi:hypothetical protein